MDIFETSPVKGLRPEGTSTAILIPFALLIVSIAFRAFALNFPLTPVPSIPSTITHSSSKLILSKSDKSLI